MSLFVCLGGVARCVRERGIERKREREREREQGNVVSPFYFNF